MRNGRVSSVCPNACFAAGTPLLTPGGPRPIEELQVGDLVLTRNEFDADGPVVARVVEEVFRRQGALLHLHVGGRVIRTTAEHPFYAEDRGWVAAGALRIGERLRTVDGWAAVEDLCDAGEVADVYNLRVADYHTYFVGGDDAGFAVWAHNTYGSSCSVENPALQLKKVNRAAATDTLIWYEQTQQITPARRPPGHGRGHGGLAAPCASL